VKPTRALAAVGLLLVLAAGGCQSCDNNGLFRVRAHPRGRVPLEQVERLVARDKTAAKAVYYVSHRHGRVPSGQLEIQVNLQSRQKKGGGIWLEWKCVFTDEGQFPIEETEWHPFLLEASVVHTVTAKSISPEAADYTFHLRTVP
jgi:hypothetical protein